MCVHVSMSTHVCVSMCGCGHVHMCTNMYVSDKASYILFSSIFSDNGVREVV